MYILLKYYVLYIKTKTKIADSWLPHWSSVSFKEGIFSGTGKWLLRITFLE